MRTWRGRSASAANSARHVRQHLRQALHSHDVRRKPRPGARLHRRRLSAGPGAVGAGHPAGPGTAAHRHVAPHQPAQGARPGPHPVGRVRGPHDRHADRPADRERRSALARLREDQGPLPPRPRRLHVPAEVRLPRLPRRRPLVGARDGHARRRGRDRAQVSARAPRCRHPGLPRAARSAAPGAQVARGRLRQSVLLSRSVAARRARRTT